MNMQSNKTIRFSLRRFHHRGGFTLIETVVAILILSLSIGALLTLTAGGFFSVRYARNQIVADNLVQESLEYIRNSRDSAKLAGTPWATWLGTLNVNASGVSQGVSPLTSGCYSAQGCIVDPYASVLVKACSGTCPYVAFYSNQSFYGYAGASYPFGVASSVPTTYVRKITAQLSDSNNQLTITASITWLNGTSPKTVTQSLLLTNW
ncbi:MAG TPA: prepilin-type N-terminal cleavage/methylation domain-containing protein [Candidatus Paceibacterota bacterium]|nr:prepilin-type N-terminal cleavage/methylation domain-containing protein [Candidatus Paceibacterota bacterium]